MFLKCFSFRACGEEEKTRFFFFNESNFVPNQREREREKFFSFYTREPANKTSHTRNPPKKKEKEKKGEKLPKKK